MTEDWKPGLGRLEENEENGGISALLDEGYDLLDGFAVWLEQTVRLDSRTTEQDCFNAEFLIDYLANYHQKTIFGLNEFELRWFLFSHYIRKAGAEAETEERLCDSLQRLYSYLISEHAYAAPDWLPGALDERAYFLKRRNDYQALSAEEEHAWQEGFRAWCEELEEDLDARSLWLPRELAPGIAWSDTRGWREAALYEEANALWQAERQELLQTGLDYEQIHDALTIAYLAWAETPQDRLDGMTPLEITVQERLQSDSDKSRDPVEEAFFSLQESEVQAAESDEDEIEGDDVDK